MPTERGARRRELFCEEKAKAEKEKAKSEKEEAKSAVEKKK